MKQDGQEKRGCKKCQDKENHGGVVDTRGLKGRKTRKDSRGCGQRQTDNEPYKTLFSARIVSGWRLGNQKAEPNFSTQEVIQTENRPYIAQQQNNLDDHVKRRRINLAYEDEVEVHEHPPQQGNIGKGTGQNGAAYQELTNHNR